MSRRVLVVTHSGRPEALTATEEAVRALEESGFTPVLAGEDVPGTSFHDLELAMVLGGDGTILRAAELARSAGVPLLGINLGHVGFLAESERDDISEAVRRVAAGDYAVEERTTLQVQMQLPGAEDPIVGWALNEAALEKSEPGRMVEVVIEVDDRPVSSFGCDGVVLATSTGSTAHAFSAGGPVVWPEVDSMIVVPLSAHALFARPLVVGPRSVVAVEILTRSPSPAVLVCDGRRRIELPAGSRVEVRRSPVPVRLARLTPAPFTDRLVKKFDLPVVGWRGRAAERRGEPEEWATRPRGRDAMGVGAGSAEGGVSGADVVQQGEGSGTEADGGMRGTETLDRALRSTGSANGAIRGAGGAQASDDSAGAEVEGR